jgi:hypothetical protein
LLGIVVFSVATWASNLAVSCQEEVYYSLINVNYRWFFEKTNGKSQETNYRLLFQVTRKGNCERYKLEDLQVRFGKSLAFDSKADEKTKKNFLFGQVYGPFVGINATVDSRKGKIIVQRDKVDGIAKDMGFLTPEEITTFHILNNLRYRGDSVGTWEHEKDVAAVFLCHSKGVYKKMERKDGQVIVKGASKLQIAGLSTYIQPDLKFQKIDFDSAMGEETHVYDAAGWLRSGKFSYGIKGRFVAVGPWEFGPEGPKEGNFAILTKIELTKMKSRPQEWEDNGSER